MFSFIWVIFAYVKNILLFVLVLSCKIGQFIISSVLVFKRFVYETLQTCEILIEDFDVFLADLIFRVRCCTEAISDIFFSIDVFVKFTLTSSKEVVECAWIIITNLWSFVFRILSSLYDILEILKNFLVVFGLGLWFAVTLLPFTFISLLTQFNYFINIIAQLLIEKVKILPKYFYSQLAKLKYFPVDALGGLVIGFSILYVSIKFRGVCCRLILSPIRVTRVYLGMLIMYLHLPRIISREYVSSDSDLESDYDTNQCNNFKCFVCLDRSRNVLLLPCRHVCLCINCDNRIRQSNVRTCPVCRTRVQKSMKIFV